MASASNRAAWLMSKQARPYEIKDAPMPVPGPDEITIRVRAVALNPIDVGVQSRGALYTDDQYPLVPGLDAAGEVTAIGEGVSGFNVGDRVAGIHNAVEVPTPRGSFQWYCNLAAGLAAPIPDSIPFTDACVLPLALCTAATALFQSNTLALPVPGGAPDPSRRTLLVWGGSSSVGACAIQLARAAGLEVAVTASPHNFALCRELGAEHVFDHASPTVVQDIVAALQSRPSAGVFSAIMAESAILSCAEIAASLPGASIVATVIPPTRPFGKTLPEGVKLGYNQSPSIKDSAVGPAVWGRWVTHALADGSLRCKPNAFVVGKGLEVLQQATDLLSQPVSARKYVVEM